MHTTTFFAALPVSFRQPCALYRSYATIITFETCVAEAFFVFKAPAIKEAVILTGILKHFAEFRGLRALYVPSCYMSGCDFLEVILASVLSIRDCYHYLAVFATGRVAETVVSLEANIQFTLKAPAPRAIDLSL